MRRLVLASLVLMLALLALGLGQPNTLTRVLLVLQDRWLLLLAAMALLGLLIAARPLAGVGAGRLARFTWRGALALGLAVALAGYAGHTWALAGYDLSRDEQMADFDAWIFAHGRLAWPLPAAWQADASMLNLLFTPPVNHPVAWMSAYLPVNALVRALLLLAGDAALTGPLLNLASVLLVWLVARRLWPGERAAAAVACLLLALSGQVVASGMTAYAMPAHLAANLGWLALFLRGTRRGDAGAIAVGALATGLHQPVFHPLFAGPFILLLAWRREWRRFAGYALAYAAIALFWLLYPRWITPLAMGPHSWLDPQVAGYLSRIRWLLGANSDHLAMMSANLLRLLTWQHLLFVPLLLAGLGTLRGNPLAMALAAGLVLPLAFFALLMPFQGHGFGYRYLHGALGNAVLLATMGWRQLAARDRRWHGWFASASLASLGLLALQTMLAQRLYAPYAGLSARISASGADYAVVGEGDAPLVLDLVLNRPDLGNRPIRLVDGEIDDADLLAARICPGGHSVALPAGSFYRPVEQLMGVGPTGAADARLAEQSKAFADAGCRVTVLR
jgi:hypothetical protein